MKQFLFAAIVITIFSITGCSDDFEVTAPYRQITIVNGVLDPADTAHYIRIQKAYLDENKSAIVMAQEPDSSFYDSLNVSIIEYNADRKTIKNTYNLWRVKTTDENYPKNDPLSDKQFFTTPNYAYKFKKADLDPQLWYQLIIINNDINRVDSSELFGIVNDDSLRKDNGFFIQAFNVKDKALNFAQITLEKKYDLILFMPQNGRMVEGIIRFNYVDSNLVTGVKRKDSVDFHFDEELAVTSFGNPVTLSALNTSFYAFLNASIGAPPNTNIVRLIDTCHIFVYAASPEIYYYKQVNLGQTGGLTADNIQPHYTTFKSKDVIGVIGSRARRSYYEAYIDNATLQVLKTNPATEPLQIRGRATD